VLSLCTGTPSAPGAAQCQPVTLVSGLSSPVAVAVKVPLGGGAPVALAVEQANPLGIAVDATCVYWADRGTAGNADGSIRKMAK
jgi:hypothetical protein